MELPTQNPATKNSAAIKAKQIIVITFLFFIFTFHPPYINVKIGLLLETIIFHFPFIVYLFHFKVKVL
jgi:hypothetical protein